MVVYVTVAFSELRGESSFMELQKCQTTCIDIYIVSLTLVQPSVGHAIDALTLASLCRLEPIENSKKSQMKNKV